MTSCLKGMTAAGAGAPERTVSLGASAAAGSGPNAAQAACGRSGVPLLRTRVPMPARPPGPGAREGRRQSRRKISGKMGWHERTV
jgi:hypothetical protein